MQRRDPAEDVLRSIGAQIREIETRGDVDPRELENLIACILGQCGMSKEDAGTAAFILVDTELRGITTHGIFHLPQYVRRLLEGTINPQAVIEVLRTGKGSAVVDGNDGLGVLVASRATSLMIELAQENGIGAVAVRHSNHFGAAGRFAAQAAEKGIVSLIFSNSSPTVAPYGGRAALLGTNPIAAGFPVPGQDPIIFDMATTTASRARLRQAAKNGTAIPLDWAFDSDGRATDDPVAAMGGTMQSLGGPKGFGLSLMAELLSSTLSGGRPGFHVGNPHDRDGRPAGTSHFLIGLAPFGFVGATEYGRQVLTWVETIRNSSPAAGNDVVRLPGSRGFSLRRLHETKISVSRSVISALDEAIQMLDSRTP